MVNINTFATIIPGFAFRDAIVDNPNNPTVVVQASSIDGSSLILNIALCKRTDDVPTRSGSFLKPNDIVVASRGSSTAGFKAAVFQGFSKPVIASSSVYIIRVKTPTKLLPEFLALYINSSQGQEQLARLLVGGVTRTVRRKDIETFDIPIPPLTNQQILVELAQNIQQQRELHARKVQNVETIFEGAIQLAARSN